MNERFYSARLYWAEKWATWANEMNFVLSHTPDAGLIARPGDQQSNELLLCYGRAITMIMMIIIF